METVTVQRLARLAARTRFELVEMFGHGKFHHFGGSLSCVEILVCLYFHKMRFAAGKLDDPRRDRFIMSKGHAVPTQYVMLSMLGVFPPEELRTIKRLGSRLQGHPDRRKTPGLEAGTGSLGQGLSIANGMALGGRLDGLDFNLYVVAGDGELQEGQIWEAAMTTAHYRLRNVCLIVDRNEYQSQGSVAATMRVEPLAAKWESFGWRALQIDGHDIRQIGAALDRLGDDDPRPLVIIADTVKGKGISFIEGSHRGHNYAMQEQEYLQARQEALGRLQQLEIEP
jgi:transketolase